MDQSATSPVVESGSEPPTFHPLAKVQCVSFADNKERKRNMRWCMHKDRNIKRLELLAGTGAGQDLAIVAGGPTLNETYKDIEKFQHVMTCGSVHDHAIRLGIKPTYHVECDPSLHQLKMYNEWSAAKYLVSSRCNRKMFKQLMKDRDVYLWHMWEQDLGKPVYNGEPALVCGATVVLSAVPLALIMQYKHMHFFGFDSSFKSFEQHHAYEHLETAQQIKVRVGDPVNGKEFLTTATWAGQAQQFEDMQNTWSFGCTFHGESMSSEMHRWRKIDIARKQMERAKQTLAQEGVSA